MATEDAEAGGLPPAASDSEDGYASDGQAAAGGRLQRGVGDCGCPLPPAAAETEDAAPHSPSSPRAAVRLPGSPALWAPSASDGSDSDSDSDAPLRPAGKRREHALPPLVAALLAARRRDTSQLTHNRDGNLPLRVLAWVAVRSGCATAQVMRCQLAVAFVASALQQLSLSSGIYASRGDTLQVLERIVVPQLQSQLWQLLRGADRRAVAHAARMQRLLAEEEAAALVEAEEEQRKAAKEHAARLRAARRQSLARRTEERAAAAAAAAASSSDKPGGDGDDDTDSRRADGGGGDSEDGSPPRGMLTSLKRATSASFHSIALALTPQSSPRGPRGHRRWGSGDSRGRLFGLLSSRGSDGSASAAAMEELALPSPAKDGDSGRSAFDGTSSARSTGSAASADGGAAGLAVSAVLAAEGDGGDGKAEEAGEEEEEKEEEPQLISQADFDDFHALARSSTDVGWDSVVDNKKRMIQVWKQQGDSPVQCVRAFFQMPGIPPNVVSELISNTTLRQSWDKVFLELRELAVEGDVEVMYQSIKAPFPVSNRDFVQYRRIIVDEETHTYTILFKNAVHPSMPERKGFVRGETIVSGYVIEPMIRGGAADSSSSQISIFSQNDIKGTVPKRIVNVVSSRAPVEWCDNLKKAAVKYMSGL